MLTENDYLLIENALVKSILEVFNENVISVVLYGSYARREARVESDLDVIIILKRIPEDRFQLHKLLDKVEEKFQQYCQDVFKKGYNPVLSPVIYSTENAVKLRPLYLDLVYYAKILYDKDNFSKYFE